MEHLQLSSLYQNEPLFPMQMQGVREDKGMKMDGEMSLVQPCLDSNLLLFDGFINRPP